MHRFTDGQVERMPATLRGPRAAVVASDALTPPHRLAQVHLPERGDLPVGSGTPEPETVKSGPRRFDGVRWVERLDAGVARPPLTRRG